MRKVLYSSLILFFYAAFPAAGAIAFDARSSASTNGAASATLSWNHTVGSGANRILVVGVVIDAAAAVTGIVYNTSQPFTLITAVTNGSIRTELWQLVNPGSGTNGITITLPSSHQIMGEAYSFAGVDQSTPVRLGHSAIATGTASAACCGNAPIANSITSASSEVGVDVLGIANVGRALLPSQNPANSNLGSNGTDNVGGSFRSSPGASVNMVWAAFWNPTNDNWAWAGASLNPAPLPIDLYSFSGACTGGKVNLSWITASETNNDYFTVEKSEEGEEYQKIFVVKGAGYSSVFHSYSVQEETISDKPAYYRLVQTDFDGGSKTFSPIVVQSCEPQNGSGIRISPNPANKELSEATLSLSGMEKTTVTIEVQNTMGEIVDSYKVTPDSDRYYSGMNLRRDLPAGLYMITARSGTQIFTTRLVLR